MLLLEGLFNEADLGAVIELRCDLVVHCDEQVSWLEKQAHPITVFLKLNSGMNRLGFTTDWPITVCMHKVTRFNI
jgi:alanine racemase